MDFGLMFFAESIMLGFGLAMDAFSVSLANGLNEPKMKPRRIAFIAGIFSVFQFLMPMIGWFCVHTIAERFEEFKTFIPWIALILLCFIGGKMLIEGIKCDCDECECRSVSFTALLVQGVATSIDALSVGFKISGHSALQAVIACLLIGVVTFFICYAGVLIGKKSGTKLAGKASILGGVILIIIGLEIFLTA